MDLLEDFEDLLVEDLLEDLLVEDLLVVVVLAVDFEDLLEDL